MPSPFAPVQLGQAHWNLPRAGLHWLLVTMALWSIGEFKGIHLITLLGTVMLLGWLLNALAVRNGLLGLRVERRIPEMVFAGQPVTIDL